MVTLSVRIALKWTSTFDEAENADELVANSNPGTVTSEIGVATCGENEMNMSIGQETGKCCVKVTQ
jgi:hypothetical protein